MDTEKQYTKKCKPEVGRGCSFCDCGAECEAKLCDGCFKLHETAWLEEYPENIPTDIVEVRFKNTRRSFYQNANNLQLKRGDIVAVEASPGHDIGVVSLTGDLVARQMRRTGFNPYNGEFKKVYRKAKPYDIEKWQEAIALEHETMIASRQIAADMGLNMKIGDVEYQGPSPVSAESRFLPAALQTPPEVLSHPVSSGKSVRRSQPPSRPPAHQSVYVSASHSPGSGWLFLH